MIIACDLSLAIVQARLTSHLMVGVLEIVMNLLQYVITLLTNDNFKLTHCLLGFRKVSTSATCLHTRHFVFLT